ncbi:MAG TPA: cytochrome c peroxidase [Planctomycetota bacterium]|nr:cytochrome c peroxidase [Planctomycetota bacterium]
MINRFAIPAVGALLFSGVLLFACGVAQEQTLPLPSDPAHYAPLEKYEAMKIPADNAMTQDKATLGWQLWFDKRLSGDGKLACYSCHVNEKGLTDGLALGKGAFDKPLTRSAPTLWNIGYHAEWYWDGRSKALEGQALAAWKLANMGGKDKEKDEIRADILETLNKAYKDPFQKVFGGPATDKQIAQALATFMRTIISKSTPFDKWQKGDEAAVSDAAKRGWTAFAKAKCTNCHVGFLLTDLQFHNVGIGLVDGKPKDVGRFANSKIEKDTGAFKTPTLRDIARTAPYFHDGSVATLEEAVKLMVNGGHDNPFLDKVNLLKAEITAAEQADIVEFLKTLTETTTIPEPKLPQ